MLRFFGGILIAQIVAIAIASVVLDGITLEKLLIILIPAAVIAITTTFWFSTIARQLADQRVSALQEQFAKEREKLNVNAEKAKVRLVRKTQKEIASQARRSRTSANLKVGVALAIAAGCGLMLIFTQMVTLGLLTLTTAGGAIGGYLARAKRETDALPADNYKVIEAGEATPPAVKIEHDQTAVNNASVANESEMDSEVTPSAATNKVATAKASQVAQNRPDTQSSASG